MRFYKKSLAYSWEFDRFHFFTSSERCAIWEALKDFKKLWAQIDDHPDEIGGPVEMVNNLIKEVEKSMDINGG